MTFGSKAAKNFDELGLVESDELELNVAVEAMINRIRNRNINTLEELRLRVESLVAPVCISPDQMPMSPEILCCSFIDGCAGLELDIRAKLVLLKLFEKMFLNDVCKVYAEANALLLQMGVLPNLKRSQAQTIADRKSQHEHGIAQALRGAQAGTNAGKPMSGLASSQVESLFQDLRSLLRSSGYYGEAANSAPAGVPVYSPQQLVATLSRLQTCANEGSDQPIPAGAPIDFKSLLDPALLRTSEARKNYSEMDLDTINLVSMLFEFILEDRQLQPTMKALIARLQIPVLKVALLDRSFFNKGGHPARKLLNEMAASALGWNEPAPGTVDRLKEKIEQVVYKVLDHFDNNIELFSDLLAEFQNFKEAEDRRGRIIEQRIRDAEEGKVINQQARLFVQAAINAEIADRTVCRPVIELLQEGWSTVMVLHCLKHGESSAQVQDDISLVRDLVWTVCPGQEDNAREKLLSLIPGVIKRIRQGLADINFDDLKMRELLSKLERAHVNAIQQIQDHREQSRLEQDEAVSDLVRETLELEREFNAMMGATEAQPCADAFDDRSTPMHARATDDAADGEAIVLVETEPSNPSLEAAAIDENDPFVRQVDNLTVGCWFEFQTDGKPERCKLAALIRSVGKYVFVNRAGVKVAEKSRLGLAAEMRQGSVQVLSDGLLFDRALESIISNLRNKSPQQPNMH
jgi:hypothetical protein